MYTYMYVYIYIYMAQLAPEGVVLLRRRHAEEAGDMGVGLLFSLCVCCCL